MYYTYNFNVEYCFKIIISKVPIYFFIVFQKISINNMSQFEHAIFYCSITSDCSADTGQMISLAALKMCYDNILLNDLF